ASLPSGLAPKSATLSTPPVPSGATWLHARFVTSEGGPASLPSTGPEEVLSPELPQPAARRPTAQTSKMTADGLSRMNMGGVLSTVPVFNWGERPVSVTVLAAIIGTSIASQKAGT